MGRTKGSARLSPEAAAAQAARINAARAAQDAAKAAQESVEPAVEQARKAQEQLAKSVGPAIEQARKAQEQIARLSREKEQIERQIRDYQIAVREAERAKRAAGL